MGVLENKDVKSPNLQAFMNSIKSFVGVGVLSMPYAFLQSGLLAGNVALFLIAIASYYTMMSLIRTKNEVIKQQTLATINNRVSTNYSEDAGAPLLNKPTEINFSEVGRYVFGRAGAYIVNFAVISSQLGVCCAYVMFISDNMHSMIGSIPIKYFALMLFPIITLLTWIRDIRFLAPTSIFANFALLLGISVVFYYGFDTFEVKPSYPLFSPSGFPTFFGLAVFAFEGINLAIPIESSMKNPQKYSRVLIFSIIVVGFLYTVFGTFGYLFFGENTQAEITLNLPTHSIIVIIVKACLIAELVFSYPVQFFPITVILEAPIFGNKDMAFKEIKRSLLRTFLVAISVIVALTIPYFNLFTAFIGAFSNSIVGFILPPLFMMKMFRKVLPKWEIFLNILILILGVVASAVSSTTALIAIIDKLSHKQ